MLRELTKSASKVAVIDRNFSFGASGIFAQEVKAALCNFPGHPPVYGYVAGLGGRDITTEVIEDIYWLAKNSTAPETESSWVGLREVDHAVGQS
jgi:pyruvate/2-oxoacid:ferredoxin oxidoreductase alpha subunit